MTPTTMTRTRLPREERMEQTLRVAHALFAERGYGPVTMDEVAAAVGVTKPLLYNYFGNKERLYLACMEPGGDALVAAVVGAVERTSTPEEALRSGIHAFFGFVDQDRASWRVIFDETPPIESGIARGVGEYRARITDLVGGGLARAALAALARGGRRAVGRAVGRRRGARALVAPHGSPHRERDGRVADPGGRARARRSRCCRSQDGSYPRTRIPSEAGRARAVGCMVSSVRRVAVIGGNRIPFARSDSVYAHASDQDMLTASLDGLIDRFQLQGEQLGEVVAGAVLKHPRDRDLTREAVLSSRLAPETPGYDVQQACGTGLEAVVLVANKIALGQIDAGIAGGVDTTSDAPLALNEDLRKILLELNRTPSPSGRLRVLTRVRPGQVVPETEGVRSGAEGSRGGGASSIRCLSG